MNRLLYAPLRRRFCLGFLHWTAIASIATFSSATSGFTKETPRAEIRPRVVTEPVKHDSDDPAIWVHPTDPSKSLIIGTDKNTDGSLYVFDLEGKIVQRVPGLKRPNNVDIAYGFQLGGKPVDIAVVTEREQQRLRVFALPDMKELDAGDLVVFDGDPKRSPMGIALYRRPRDGALFAIVSGKSGPKDGYLA